MAEAETSAAKRLDGWKSIASYFNRDRTTVMRWARERDLPVRRIPGGKSGSVFAFDNELAAWALRHDDLSTLASDQGLRGSEAFESTPRVALTLARPSRARLVTIGLMVGALLILGGWTWSRTGMETLVDRPTSSQMLPDDAELARDYVSARDHWAKRTPADLSRAIQLYQSVIERDPGFAPAHSGLAEAWLLICEYGEVAETAAYRQALQHAERAVRLDPSLPSAHRALGFIDYWWSSDTSAALKRFDQALRLDERDGLTHFWYANILADLGNDRDAQRAYDRARILSPGSRVIEIEQACSHWQAGRDEIAFKQLTVLARQAPEDATVQNCLAWLHISRGDVPSFAEAFRRRAQIRGEPQLMRLSAEMDTALRRSSSDAIGVLVTEGRREIASGTRKLRQVPAFYASAMGDRATLVELLEEANGQRERWYSVPITRRIAARWQGDVEVRALLATLTPRLPTRQKI